MVVCGLLGILELLFVPSFPRTWESETSVLSIDEMVNCTLGNLRFPPSRE